MKNTEKVRSTRIFGQIKTGIMAALVISLVVLVGIYISGTTVWENASGLNIDSAFEKLWSVQNSGEQFGLDGDNLLPEFIGYKQASGTPMGSVGSKSSLDELYGVVKPCILELFGKDSVCRSIPTEEGARRFSAAQEGDEFVYLRYHTPVLYQLVYAYAADKLTLSESDVASGLSENIGAYISDVVIVPDSDYAAHRFVAYATDLEGNYYEFRPGDHIVSSSFYISKLAESASGIDTHPFSFVYMEGAQMSQPMVDGEIEVPILSYSEPESLSEENKNQLLTLFGYNLDKLNFYTDGYESVYVDSTSRLRLGSGTISFITTSASPLGNDRGIDIGSLLGYIGGDSYSLFDKLTAVDNLIRKHEKIFPDLLSGEVGLCLGDVYTEGGYLVVEYFMTYNSVRISNSEKPALRARLTESHICELEINALTVTASDETAHTTKPRYILEKMVGLNKIPEGRLPRALRLTYKGSEAVWTLYLAD